jgi:hypothetical protein
VNAKELAEELSHKPPLYEVVKSGEGAVHETVTDHENQKVIIY